MIGIGVPEMRGKGARNEGRGVSEMSGGEVPEIIGRGVPEMRGGGRVRARNEGRGVLELKGVGC